MRSVTLSQPHTHAGQPYVAGDVLKLSAVDADWLIAQHIAYPTDRSTTRAEVHVAATVTFGAQNHE